jgi:acyl transferase domain-containing protein/NADPH:quinone reductase-like Zn-dependent oxidoreductase/SAM-dependent methyltransferase/NADP-dependent 3-hydroxy acid dehydrogenase YdfG
VGSVFASEQSPGDALLVGSTKTNVGHGEGASALASIMKVVLSLEHGAIPPVFDLQTLNPNIDFEGAAVKVVQELTPWPSGQVRRASINSFGYGGANAHCIIDDVHTLFPDYVKPGVFKRPDINHPVMHADCGAAVQEAFMIPKQDPSTSDTLDGSKFDSSRSSTPASTIGTSVDSSDELPNDPTQLHYPIGTLPKKIRMADAETRQLVLLPFTAHSKESLKLNIDALTSLIGDLQLSDVAYTLASKRSKLSQRTFRVVDTAQPAEGLVSGGKVLRAPLQTSNVGFVFTGQGAQWSAMGAELFEYRTFASTIGYLDSILASLTAPPTWTLRDILTGGSNSDLIDSAEISQTVCTALQIGLVDLLASWSVRPLAVAGHSSGEIAAAYASGRLSAAEAVIAAYYRGQAVSVNEQKGLMLAVGLSSEQTLPYIAELQGKVVVAAYNSPGSTTLSGDTEAIKQVSKAMDQDGVFNRMLKTGGNAYHSHHMLPLGVEYNSMLSKGFQNLRKQRWNDLSRCYAKIPWMSSVTPGKTFSMEEHPDAEYWRDNLESPVRFSDAVSNLVNSADVHILIEIGPHPALKSPIDQILKNVGKSSISYASTMRRQLDSRESMLQLAGTLFCLNADVDLIAVNSLDRSQGLAHGSITVNLPPYQYAYGPIAYHESRQSKEYRHREVIRHDLLGSKVTGTAKLRPQWRNILRMKDVPWLSDHRLLPDAVFPAAGYIATAIEAVTLVHSEYMSTLPITGYSLRNVSIKSSLQVPEDDYGIEIMTSLELEESFSTWFTFSISTVTRESDNWTEHCTGRIKVETAASNLSFNLNMAADHKTRAMDSNSWYRKFAAIGLGYGPAFRPLSDIRADTRTKNQTSAKVALKTTAATIIDESSYLLHPASLDGAIQLGIIACYNTQTEEANSAFVPVHFSQICLSTEFPKDLSSANVVARGKRHGLRSAHIDLAMSTPDGCEILQIEGLRCVAYSRTSHNTKNAYSSPLSILLWKPDIRFLENSQCHKLFPPPLENVGRAPLWGVVNELAYSIVYDVYETFAGQKATRSEPKPSGEVGKFFEWIKRRGTLDDSDLRREFKKLSAEDRLARIEELVSQAPDVIEVQTSKLLRDHMDDILSEKRTGIDVIISQNLLTPLYQKGLLMTSVYPQLFKVLDSLGHANPNMRYIEIGGGTGGATRIAMQAIRGQNGIKSYHDYTFTDISPGFLATAREALSGSGFEDMVYNVLDAEQDPVLHGYEPVYDVVIACQVLHATSNMKKTLKNVGKLLKPGGKLVLVETTQNFIVPGVVVGTFTGYWAGIPDGRVDAPFMSVDMWDANLKAVGFSGAELVLDDFPSPHNTTSVIVSTFMGASPLEVIVPIGGDLRVLHSTESPRNLHRQLLEEVKRRGLEAISSQLQDAPSETPPGSEVVVFLDDGHLQLGDDNRILAAFQHLARSAVSVTVLTSCGIARGRNPDGALVAGLLRVLKTENPSCQFLSIDIDGDKFDTKGDDTETGCLTRCIVDRVLELHVAPPTVENNSPTDREFTWQDGALWVSRFVAVPEADTSVSSEYYLSENEGENIGKELLPLGSLDHVSTAFEMPGVLGSLFFVSDRRPWTPLPPDCLDIKVTAISLAHEDLDAWSGRADNSYPLFEFSGTVTAIGMSVQDFSIGDCVMGLSSGNSQIGSFARIPRTLVLKLKPSDDLVEMATMPRSYCTVVYALEHVAHISSESWTDKTVLVQSATTHTGIAAIILAKAKGADVIAMVDNQQQADFLARETNIAPSHVFVSELRTIAKATRNGGFDVILGTAQQDLELLYMTPQFLKPLGHLIYTGQMEGASEQALRELDMRVLSKKNASFSVVDFAGLVDSAPTLGSKLLQTVDRYLREDTIKPLKPFSGNSIDISDLSRSLMSFSNSGGGQGKLLFTFLDPSSEVKMLQPPPTTRFDPDSYYVITGALGGLGQSIIQWMVSRGARHLLLLSRRPIDDVPSAQQLIQNLSRTGVDAKAIVCDVTVLSQVQSIFDQFSADRSIKGIIHAAVSWRDLSFDKLSTTRWQESLAAKVKGTKNLHEATRSMSLDFFVMTTSLLSVYALATQSAYTAANNFQDAFARHRRALGLPASTISFSLIRGVGETGSNLGTIDTFERNKTMTLGEKQFLALFECAFMPHSPGSTTNVDPLSNANLTTCLDPAGMLATLRDAGDAGPTPRWHSDGRVSIILRAFADAQQHGSTLGGSDATGNGETSIFRLQRDFEAAILAGPAEESATVTLVESAIASTVADMLFIDLEDINTAKSVADYGVDSLVSTPC